MNFIQVKNKRINFDRVDYYEPVGEDCIRICYSGIERIFQFENKDERNTGLGILDDNTAKQLVV